MAESESKSQTFTAAATLVAIWAAILVTAFVAFRTTDLLRLPSLLGNLGGGPLFSFDGLRDTAVGALVAILIGYAWYGWGTLILRVIGSFKREKSSPLESAVTTAVGMALWSMVWFFLGLVGAYFETTAIVALLLGVPIGVRETLKNNLNLDRKYLHNVPNIDFALILICLVPILLGLISSLAPPIAKDTLLYHFAVPKAFIAQHSNLFIDGNIASYLGLGTEMQITWAMLLGGLVSPRAAETAAGCVVFLFLIRLLKIIYGWARELNISRTWSLVATVMVATVPTAYHVASSGYVDLALALFITLAIRSLCRWWKSQDTQSIILIAIFLGVALSIKLTTVFVIAAFALIVLLRARETKNPVASAPGSDTGATSSSGRVILTGFSALLLAGAIASPWYIRTWAATGSPVFPFYMSIWPGQANGWDVERSNLFQAMNSQYGGADVDKLNYLTAPLRVSIMAQPEQPANYDGVLGVAFLIGLPLLVWALWKLDLAVEIKIMTGVAGIMYLFWLFSSEQLRYLLPIVPVLAIAIAASAEKISGAVSRVAKVSLVAASVCGLLTSFAWFCQKAPLRVVLGGETRDQYLTRNIDYYPYYKALNNETAADAKVWLINMRRDTYHLDRPYFSDYLFEDWTLRHMVWEARSVEELRAKTAAMGVQYVLARHDFLFDYDRTTLVDEKRPHTENEAKIKIAREFILDPLRTIKADNKFSLVKVF